MALSFYKKFCKRCIWRPIDPEATNCRMGTKMKRVRRVCSRFHRGDFAPRLQRRSRYKGKGYYYWHTGNQPSFQEKICVKCKWRPRPSSSAFHCKMYVVMGAVKFLCSRFDKGPRHLTKRQKALERRRG